MQTYNINPNGHLVSLDEVAKHLGVSPRHVQSLRAKRLIPAIKISSRCLRFRITDVDRALEKLTVREVQ